MKFKTETGSEYEINDGLIRRVNDSSELRADGVWVRLYGRSNIEVGYPVELVLESLAPPGTGSTITRRTTSYVTEIFDDDSN